MTSPADWQPGDTLEAICAVARGSVELPVGHRVNFVELGKYSFSDTAGRTWWVRDFRRVDPKPQDVQPGHQQDLVHRLQDPNFRGPMQHCHSWSDIDAQHADTTTEITTLRAEVEQKTKRITDLEKLCAAVMTPADLTGDGSEYIMPVTHPKRGWTCFHCGDTFHRPDAAAHHFGADTEVPACKGMVEKLRAEVERLRERLVVTDAMVDRADTAFDDAWEYGGTGNYQMRAALTSALAGEG